MSDGDGGEARPVGDLSLRPLTGLEGEEEAPGPASTPPASTDPAERSGEPNEVPPPDPS